MKPRGMTVNALQLKWSKVLLHNQMARGNGERGRGISRGRGNVAQAPVYPNSQESVTRGNGEGGLPSSKLNAIRGRGLGIGITGGRGLPSSRPTVATRSRQGGPDLDNISHDNNMASK
ncbi:hypothetical protein Pyn_39117 [Prunus yedoensis var. nudiflora]|uniref:Uncharacterized protein n=1 Tax=Prunus yedoensis var. nudiflora TaxID=2094558 RepID=A0A314ZJI2_PRUYE|nr:hypothetical protein Pyn_39117 [Prunus yedoensis var. nudiflora]